MVSKMISIIVPVYNGEKYIEKCILSIANQTYLNIQIIVVDDGSTDNTVKIVQKLMERDERIMYLYQTNKGVSAARNLALSKAEGEYIGFCDSDDWIESDMYEVLMNNILYHGADISIVQYFLESEEKGIIAPFGNDSVVEIYTAEDALKEMCKGCLLLGQLWNKLFKASAISETRFDESISICEDILFITELMPNVKKVVFENTCKYHYIQTENSAMNKSYTPKYLSRREAYLKIISICENNNYNKVLSFAKRALIFGNISIAEKMSAYNCLNKKYYNILKQDILDNRKKAAVHANWRNRIELTVFLASKTLFELYVSILKLGL